MHLTLLFLKHVLEGEINLKVMVMETILFCSLVRREDPEWYPTQKCSDHFSIHTIIYCGGRAVGGW